MVSDPRFLRGNLRPVPDPEPIVLGDFVKLLAGTVIGLVEEAGPRGALVVWLTSPPQRSIVPHNCLQRACLS